MSDGEGAAEFEFIKSDRQGVLLLRNNFLYKRKSVAPGRKSEYYYCVQDKCWASVHIADGLIKVEKGDHTHPNHEERVVRLRVRNNLRKRVAEEPFVPLEKLYRYRDYYAININSKLKIKICT